MSQGSILGAILFNVFLNDLYLCLQNSDLDNFVDDNTSTATCENFNDLQRTLEKDIEKAINWFKINQMIANLEKF